MVNYFRRYCSSVSFLSNPQPHICKQMFRWVLLYTGNNNTLCSEEVSTFIECPKQVNAPAARPTCHLCQNGLNSLEGFYWSFLCIPKKTESSTGYNINNSTSILIP